MSLVVKKVWDRQPQTVTQIDWDNPLTRELVFSTSLASSAGFQSVGKDKRIGTITTAGGTGITSKGSGQSFGTSGYIDFGSQTVIGDTTPATITLFERTNVAQGFSAPMSIKLSALDWIWIRGTDPAYYCAVGPGAGGGVPNFDSVGVQTAGEQIRFVVVAPNGLVSTTGLAVWANGRKLTSSVTNFGAVSASTTKIGWDGYDTRFSGVIQDVNIIGRAWSDSEVAEYFKNPYQIYAPMTKVIPIATPGVGGTAFSPRAPYMTGVLSIKG